MPTVKELTDRLKASYGDDAHIAAPVWVTDDVIEFARRRGITVSKEQAAEILEHMHNHHDAEQGICWLTIDAELDWFQFDQHQAAEIETSSA